MPILIVNIMTRQQITSAITRIPMLDHHEAPSRAINVCIGPFLSANDTAQSYVVVFFLAGVTELTVTVSPLAVPFTVALFTASLSSSASWPSRV